MQSSARTLVVLGTGGTIAGEAASVEDYLAYSSAAVPVAALVAKMAERRDIDVESEQVAQIDSKDMDFATWLQLARRVAHHLARAEVRGIVVSHGTDTLEETAYFLQRVLAPAKPVALTAAMRPASSRQADGPQNLADAATVAMTTAEPGVVAVLAGTVHAARDVRKVHPYRLDAFSSGDAGPLAYVEAGRLRLLRAWPGDAALGLDVLPEETASWPLVGIVTSAAGADPCSVTALVEHGFVGIVVAATGNGTIHRELEGALHEAVQRGIAVVRSTRCQDGTIVEAVAGPGSGVAGFASAADLTPAKARVELILSLLANRRGAASS